MTYLIIYQPRLREHKNDLLTAGTLTLELRCFVRYLTDSMHWQPCEDCCKVSGGKDEYTDAEIDGIRVE
ncbi:hypothetical protein QVD17_32018 [Tagetes erecta]|uniref:Uncharacterized protein n=1 Tax=Tagetes erecta TaxID=13708 RepID=A0AAD8K4H1_TARER|nr:hypothetical protein QVD17_32018 [Tagetes erecta]